MYQVPCVMYPFPRDLILDPWYMTQKSNLTLDPWYVTLD